MPHTQSYQKITLAKENTQILKCTTKCGLHSTAVECISNEYHPLGIPSTNFHT